MGKTVYLIGAGFSRPAGLPVQADIYPLLKRLSWEELVDKLRFVGEEFTEAQRQVTHFVDSLFLAKSSPSLEDVFTLLDLSISRGEYCGRFSWNELLQIRESLRKSIIICLYYKMSCASREKLSFYDDFAAKLIDDRVKDGQDQDKLAVIALNWDTLLDDAIYRIIYKAKCLKYVDIDYCCFTTALNESPHRSSITQKASGLYNIKLCKLHGSINWLRCPNCDRLFTGIGAEDDIWEEYIAKSVCPGCKKLPELNTVGGPELEPFLITPTFVKVFESQHIRMVWHNAYMELKEANKIVFIGYSLPEADYHVRALLRRAVNEDVAIDVVLTRRDTRKPSLPKYVSHSFAAERYKDFFGSRINLFADGVEAYFQGGRTLSDSAIRSGVIKKRFNELERE